MNIQTPINTKPIILYVQNRIIPPNKMTNWRSLDIASAYIVIFFNGIVLYLIIYNENLAL